MRFTRPIVAASFFLAALVPMTISACSCPEGPDTPFLDFAPTASLVVRGKVLAVRASGSQRRSPVMTIAVLEVMLGKHPGSTVTISGDRCADCWHSVYDFPIGSEWVLAISLEPRKAPKAPLLVVLRCAESRLPVEDGAVVGSLELTAAGTVSTESTTLEDLRTRLRSRLSKVARGLTPACSGLASLATDARR